MLIGAVNTRRTLLPQRMVQPTLHGPNHNQLLAALPQAEFVRLSKHLELVLMPRGEMLYEPGNQLRYALFPTTSIVSLHYSLESGASAEAASVGCDGIVGISLFMGGDTTPSSAVVLTAGHAYRLERQVLKQEFDLGGVVQRLLLRYTQALMTQMAQTAACNRHHTIEQQFARWLLLALDRTPAQDLAITQQLVAHMLGVRRESVTEAAGHLQQYGCIHYHRGHIAVVDRGGLETRACECYGVLKSELNRLMSDVQYRQYVVPETSGRSAAISH